MMTPAKLRLLDDQRGDIARANDGSHLYFPNWSNLQHYQKKATDPAWTPSWIKLYVSLLENDRFLSLREPTQAHLLKLQLAAARRNNLLPYSESRLARAIDAQSAVDLENLIAGGWLKIGGKSPEDDGNGHL